MTLFATLDPRYASPGARKCPYFLPVWLEFQSLTTKRILMQRALALHEGQWGTQRGPQGRVTPSPMPPSASPSLLPNPFPCCISLNPRLRSLPPPTFLQPLGLLHSLIKTQVLLFLWEEEQQTAAIMSVKKQIFVGGGEP